MRFLYIQVHIQYIPNNNAGLVLVHPNVRVFYTNR